MINSATETRLTAAPKILVLGATGPTGRLIVTQALERGCDVTALVRSPEKLSDLKGAKLFVGDGRDGKILRQALKGRDAVISALGTSLSVDHLVKASRRTVLTYGSSVRATTGSCRQSALRNKIVTLSM